MRKLWYLSVVSFILFSCVSKKQYQALQGTLDSTRVVCETNETICTHSKDSLITLIKFHEVNLENQRLKISALRDSIQICGNELEENKNYIKSLGEDINDKQRRLFKEIDDKNKAIQNKELQLNDALAQAEKERLRLETLRKQLESVSQRVKELEAELRRKDSAVLLLKEAIMKALAGFEELDVKVEYRNGKVYVILPEKLLFKSGSTTVDAKGVEALNQISAALIKQKDVQVGVEGHTDNVPMNSEKIKDNWDLSVLRATSISKIMIQQGISPKRITAMGRGETMPVASNDTPEGRAKNRRTEIILTPQLDKILEILNN